MMTTIAASHGRESERVGHGTAMARFVYILYLAGLVTGIAMLAGLAFAIACRDGSDEPAASHFQFQIDLVWRSILALGAAFLLYLMIGIAGALTMGAALVLDVVPLGIALCWLVWAVMSIVLGMRRLARGEVPA